MNATKWSAIAELMAKIVAPIVNIVLARLLTPTEFGVVASITIITSFADIFTDAGFQKFVIQHEFDSPEQLREYSNVAFTSNVTLSVVIYSIIFLSRRKLAALTGCPNAYDGLAVAALTVLCTSFSSIAVAGFRRELNFKPLFHVRLCSSLIPLFVTVPLAILLKSYWAIVIGTVFQQIFIAVVSVSLSRYKPRIRWNKKMFSDMLSFSVWNLMETLSIWFAGQANVLIVGNALSSYYLGLYKTGMSTINSYMSIITAAITPVLFSALSRSQNNKKLFEDTFCKFQKVISIFVFPMGVGILLYRRLAVQILLGSQWMEIADFMGLWALMSALTISVSNMACEVYRSMGKPNVSFLLQVLYLTVYIPVIYVSAHKEFRTLCLAGCFIRLLPIVFDLMALKILFGISPGRIFGNTRAPIIAVIGMSAVGLLCQMVSNKILWQFASIAICVISYGAILLLLPSTREELSDIKKMFHNVKK